MNRQKCGYGLCSCYGVHFISRYREQNDYCVDGHRVTVDDELGFVRESTSEQRERVKLFLLAEYGKYCIWHAEYLKPISNGGYCPDLASFSGAYLFA